MKRLILAVMSLGLLAAGGGCCSCVHNAAAWRKGVAAPHVCGEGHGCGFGSGCCPCGGSCCNSCDGGCGGGCGCGCGGGCGRGHSHLGHGYGFKFPFSIQHGGQCGGGGCGGGGCFSCDCGGCNTGSCGHGGHWFGGVGHFGHTGHGGCDGWPHDGGVSRCDPCCDDGCWDHGRCDSCGAPCEDDCDRWLNDDDFGRGYQGGHAGCFGCGGCDGCGGGCGEGPRRPRCGWNLGWLDPHEWFGGCRGCGCGAAYWHEWISDPPCCHDPCDCCANWTGPTCNNGPYCGRCANAGGAGPQYGPFYGAHSQRRSSPTYARQPGRSSGEVQSYVMERPAMSAPRATTTTPRTATRVQSPAPKKPRPTGRTSTKAQQPTLAVPPGEEKVVEGSFKVVEDRAVQPSAKTATKPAPNAAPRSANRRSHKAVSSAYREPTT